MPRHDVKGNEHTPVHPYKRVMDRCCVAVDRSCAELLVAVRRRIGLIGIQ